MLSKTPLMVVASAIALSGCASVFNTASNSDFSCPGMPQGVVCKTPTAVYKSTHGELKKTDYDLPLGEGEAVAPDKVPSSLLSDNASPSAKERRPTVPLPGVATGATVSGVTSAALGGLPNGYARPVREAAQVMRIWIAPWVDKNDDLHFPTYVFTEVQARKWAVGKPEFAGRGAVIPYKVLTGTPAAPSAEKQAGARGVESEQRDPAAAAIPNPLTSGMPSPSDIQLD